MRFFLMLFVIFLSSCGNDGAGSVVSSDVPVSSVSRAVPVPVSRNVADLSGLKVLPRTLHYTLEFKGERVIPLSASFSTAQPTRFLNREHSQIWFELKDNAGAVLFAGGLRDPLEVVDESGWRGNAGAGLKPVPAKAHLDRALVPLRIPIRVGGEKLVITRLGREKKRLATIDLKVVMPR